jgi:DNA-directed RNA polymerase specialized sigma24 family protein
MKRPTVKQVAEFAGVSTMTASLALRGKVACTGGVSRQTEAKVRAAAEKLGYTVNTMRGRNASFVGEKLWHVPTQKDGHLARFYCRPWEGKGIDIEELHGEAIIALMRAAVTFRPGKGAQFPTHLMWAVRSRLRAKFRHKLDQQHKYGVFWAELDAPISERESETVASNIAAAPVYEESELFIRDLLSLADPEEGYFIERRYVEDFSPIELAQESRRPVGDVVNLIESGLSRIRAAMGEAA